jgi:hypothetical protein
MVVLGGEMNHCCYDIVLSMIIRLGRAAAVMLAGIAVPSAAQVAQH